MDAIVHDFYRGAIHEFWPPEREHVESKYESIPFPFDECDTPRFSMKQRWTVKALTDYLRTWSAVKRYQAQTGIDPVSAIEAPLRDAWGGAALEVGWPLTLKVGRIQ